MARKYWIQEAEKNEGALSRQLGIPIRKNIPVTLLRKIKKAKIGTKIRTPAGVKRVTRLLKKRAVLALTLKKLSRKKKKRKSRRK